MIINESKSKSSKFLLDTTGMDKYDHIMHNKEYHEANDNLTYRIAWMKPCNYVMRCARDIFGVSYNRLYQNRFDNKVYKYKNMMKNGEQFDMPVLNYATHNQEGLHRSIAAMILDPEELIPVMVVYNKMPLDQFIPDTRQKKVVTV